MTLTTKQFNKTDCRISLYTSKPINGMIYSYESDRNLYDVVVLDSIVIYMINCKVSDKHIIHKDIEVYYNI